MKPRNLPPAVGAVYGWLAANGICEWLPEHPIIEVGLDSISYTAFGFMSDSCRGWEPQYMAVEDGAVVVEWRTVPLRAWPSPAIAAAAALAGVALIDGTVGGG